MTRAEQRNCPECGGRMQTGFLIDRRQGLEARAIEWAEGEPVRNWLGVLRLRGRTRYRAATFRCEKCGRLASWAHDRLA